MSGTRGRDLAIAVLQYGLGLGALAWLLTQVDLTRTLDLLAGVDPSAVAAVLAVSVIGTLGRFYSWFVVIRGRGPVSFLAASRTSLIVNFVNQLLPSRLSGRLAAPFVLRAETGLAYADATAVAGVHTGVYAVLYGLVALVGLALVAPALSAGLLVVVALSTGLYVLAGAVILLTGSNLSALDRAIALLQAGLRRVPRIGPGLADRIDGATSATAASSEAFRALSTDPGLWIKYAVGWAATLLLAPGVRVFVLLASFGYAYATPFALPLVLVTAYSVTLLPLTPGGIGITEATATAVFVALGVPAEVIVPVIFVDRFLGLYLPAIVGWYPSLTVDPTSLAPE